MTNYRFGYGRVSTYDQNLDIQREALVKAGASKVFLEKITGTNLERPELKICNSI